VFEAAALVLGVVAGAVAALSGFGIGSVLTPLFSTQLPVKVAVAAVSVPHFFATAFRLYLLREHVHRRVLLSFGLMSALGGLAGAAVHLYMRSIALGILFGALLLFVGISGLTGLASRMEFRGPWAWVAGLSSGFLGGLVGNQGGIRSGAMLGLDVPRDAFVATATAAGLVVDAVRLPVYLAAEGSQLLRLLPVLAAATAGALIGTVLGLRLLRRIPERIFKPMVSLLILGLGTWMIVQAVTA
jgi:uncharacterized protein